MAGTRDFRKLDASAQAEVRRMAVAMVKAGRTLPRDNHGENAATNKMRMSLVV